MLFLFFFNDPATTEIYTLSLHDALPISPARGAQQTEERASVNMEVRSNSGNVYPVTYTMANIDGDRKSTRLNSSHVRISYAVFCLKKKKKKTNQNKP